jgi:RNA polymerase sigma factor (sigma-70 family)
VGATAELDLAEADVEALHALLERREVELVEEIDPGHVTSLNVEPARSERAHRKTPVGLQPEPTTDALQVFLRDIGRVRLLTAQQEVSLAKRIERGEAEFGQLIADDRSESPFELAVAAVTKTALHEALQGLSYRERRVLELRYGLGGQHPSTLDEVGRRFNVTRERIRQIENHSLKKLQGLAQTQQLRSDFETAEGALSSPAWGL